MQIPAGMNVVFQGDAKRMREVQDALQRDGIRTATGAIPGG